MSPMRQMVFLSKYCVICEMSEVTLRMQKLTASKRCPENSVLFFEVRTSETVWANTCVENDVVEGRSSVKFVTAAGWVVGCCAFASVGSAYVLGS